MAPFTKPETVLKQAEGLVSVGQNHAALQSLTEMFTSKRFRSTPLSSLEPIMLRFVELCVDLRKGRTAKEGLMQYKNISQNTSVGSIEVVIKRFLQLADAKVQEAQEKADKVVALIDVDDLEASETPEGILLGAVSGDQNKDRTDRALVTPWLKFLWESYRTALETLKNNARLEVVYQQVANQAFKFCLRHVRKVEFRRLCETLRLHLSNVAKYSHQPHSINLSDPDTLQHHLDTRFAQLNSSVELELWQEAFRSVEDVHNLLTMAKKAPRPAMMANYYEKLTKIFLTSGNALYHAAAWSRYYSVVRAQGGKTEEELSKLAGLVLVSALAVPVTQESEDGADEMRSKAVRLTALLGLSKEPTRTGLLKEALARNTLKLSDATIRSLYQILEVTFHPLTICSAISPVFKQLSEDPSYAPYLPLLHRVLLSRLFSQLSTVYSSVKISHVLELVAPLETPVEPSENKQSYNQERIEAFIMGCAKRGELQIRVDHAEGSITFTSEVFGSSVASSATEVDGLPQSSNLDIVRTRLSRLAESLSVSLSQLYPQASAPSPTDEFRVLVKAAEEERKRLALHRTLTSRRAELLSELRVRKEKEEQSRIAEATRREKEEEGKRMVESVRKREQEKIQRELESVKKKEAETILINLKAKGGLKVDIEDMDNLDTSKLVALQVEQLDKEKRELSERLRIVAKRVDHLERAMRKEERPLLALDYERQQAEDQATYQVNHQVTIAAARQRHQDDIETKKRMGRMMADYYARRQEIAGKREEEFQRKREEARKKTDDEKAKRRATVLKQREAERKKREEEERIQREEEAEQARLEEEQRLAEERLRTEEEARRAEQEALKRVEEEKAAAQRKQRELERAEAAEKARLQMQREEEAEARRKNKSLGRDTPDAGGDGWRRSARPSTPVRSSTPSARPSTPPVSNGSPRPSQRPGGVFRPPAAREREASVGTPPASASPRPLASTPSSGGGWREREAAKKQQELPADAEGFQTVAPKQGVWRPRGRGGGDAPPR